jgi:hypothetical protein
VLWDSDVLKATCYGIAMFWRLHTTRERCLCMCGLNTWETMHAEYWSGNLLGTVHLKFVGGLEWTMCFKEVCYEVCCTFSAPCLAASVLMRNVKLAAILYSTVLSKEYLCSDTRHHYHRIPHWNVSTSCKLLYVSSHLIFCRVCNKLASDVQPAQCRTTCCSLTRTCWKV